MPYHVSIGYANPRITRPGEEPEQVAANQYTAVPFPVDTLEEAHQLVALSKSPVWVIRKAAEGEHSSWGGKDVEVSPMVLRTRELQAEDSARAEARRLETIERINAQPKTATLTYGGIPVTFERRDVDPARRRWNSDEANVTVSAMGEGFTPRSFITRAGNLQKAKFLKWGNSKLAPLAPYLREIEAVADQLRHGNYKVEGPVPTNTEPSASIGEEATP